MGGLLLMLSTYAANRMYKDVCIILVYDRRRKEANISTIVPLDSLFFAVTLFHSLADRGFKITRMYLDTRPCQANQN